MVHQGKLVTLTRAEVAPDILFVREEAGPTELGTTVVWEIRVEVEWTICLRPTPKGSVGIAPCASRPEPTEIKHTANPSGLVEPELPVEFDFAFCDFG